MVLLGCDMQVCVYESSSCCSLFLLVSNWHAVIPMNGETVTFAHELVAV